MKKQYAYVIKRDDGLYVYDLYAVGDGTYEFSFTKYVELAICMIARFGLLDKFSVSDMLLDENIKNTKGCKVQKICIMEVEE